MSIQKIQDQIGNQEWTEDLRKYRDLLQYNRQVRLEESIY